ncbi:MAG: hypothetical protein DMF90_17415 [Acidobacteria bacterium]|nr:MAG: hypothetical protein DMF90_17415 [Acidobacteriota bacterium]
MAFAAIAAAVVVVGFGMSAQQPAPLTTPWGAPDLQGIWDHKITTPLERPEKFAGRELLTDEEIAALDKDSTALPVGKGRDVRAERGTDADRPARRKIAAGDRRGEAVDGRAREQSLRHTR